MAIASVEIGTVVRGEGGSSIHGLCLAQESLTVSGTTATLAAAVTQAQVDAGAKVFRVSTDDAACYVAVGSTPDPTAVSRTAATSARRLIPAGGTIEMPAQAGDKVAVRAVS